MLTLLFSCASGRGRCVLGEPGAGELSASAEGGGGVSLSSSIIADDLMKREVFKLPDPFVAVHVYASNEPLSSPIHSLATPIVRNTLNPYWSASFEFEADDNTKCVQSGIPEFGGRGLCQRCLRLLRVGFPQNPCKGARQQQIQEEGSSKRN